MTNFNTLILLVFIGLISLLAVDVFAKQEDGIVRIARFSMMELDGWENKSFQGETNYSIQNNEQTSYLEAVSKHSASALYKKIKVDINNTPYLNWSWRVDHALPQLNEKEKNGDDYAARIYVVFKTGFTPLSAKALNYIWSSNSITDTHWPNAFTEKAIMIPLRSKQDETGTWQTEKVNIKEDLMKYFGKIPQYIDGVALMTDTDNSKSNASASYGDIYFSAD
jgi:hypothetical protein